MVITHADYMAARKQALHAMQYLRAQYSAFDRNSVQAYNLMVDAADVAYADWKQYRNQ